jgi:hypothetical protein
VFSDISAIIINVPKDRFENHAARLHWKLADEKDFAGGIQ